MIRLRVALPLLAAVLLLAAPARAFCGFYVSSGGAELWNNATRVVVLRDGIRTVLSIQNNYQGPPSDFAMVVPVPVVLQKENVKTLPREIFDRVDRLTAPRLVEYWEQDPCRPVIEETSGALPPEERATGGEGVKVEAHFAVGEYDVVVLSADDSLGLDGWLRANHYRIPDGAEPYLRPYVAGGSKFFVAKVDVTKLALDGGVATLSPLRFYYDTDTFTLPIRLGLLNAHGPQDLIVHIVATDRYEVANYPNVVIPTNLDVTHDVSHGFGPFYVSLFDATLAKSPRAVVTEYAWSTGMCDPCPAPPLDEAELALLGTDVATTARVEASLGVLVVTRLHARYTKNTLGEDLVFKKAAPILGGRDAPDFSGHAAQGTEPSPSNAFQARYYIRHPWDGPVNCDTPRFGGWGGPLDGRAPAATMKSAQDLATTPRDVALAQLVIGDVEALGIHGTGAVKRGRWVWQVFTPARSLLFGLVLGLAATFAAARRLRPEATADPEKRYELASLVAVVPLLLMGACLFVRFDPEGPTLFEYALRETPGAAILPLFVTPAMMGVVTLMARRRRAAPQLPTFVLGAVFAGLVAVVAFGLWIVLVDTGAGDAKGPTFWASSLLSPLAVVVLFRARGKGGWGRWAHAIASVACACVGLALQVYSTAFGLPVTLGLDAWLAATALLAPIAGWIVWGP